MKIFRWNCQGLNNHLIVQALHSWYWRERPDFVFVMESMVEKRKFEGIRYKLGFERVCVLVVMDIREASVFGGEMRLLT